MKRDPSIHLKKSSLHKLAREYVVQSNNAIKVTQAIDLVNFLIKNGGKHNATNRSILVSNARVEKKVDNVLKSSQSDTMFMAVLIKMTRISLGHRGVSEIKSGSRDWGVVKQMTSAALEFCSTFDLPKKEGFTKYLKIGMEKMAKFGLTKYLSMKEAIFTTYESHLEILSDKWPNNTKNTHNEYVNRIFNITGLNNDYTKNPEKYVYFVRVTKYCMEVGLLPKQYLEAQFNGIGFKDTYPDPAQLVGDKANERLNRYLFEHKIKINEKKKNPTDWKKILGHG